MKIRCGFISNSSSSSFVIIGYPTNFPEEFFPTKEEQEQARDNGELFYVECIGFNYIIGQCIANNDGEYLEDSNYYLTELQNIAYCIAEKYRIPQETIRLFMGTMPS